MNKSAFFATLAFALAPVTAFAQAAGTVSLPTGVGVNTPYSVSTAVNNALTHKVDTINGSLTNPAINGSTVTVSIPQAAINAAWAGTGFGFSYAPSVAQMVTALSGTTSGTLYPGNNPSGFVTASQAIADAWAGSGFGYTSAPSVSQLSTALAGTGLSVHYGTTIGTAAQGNDSRITGACQTSGCTMTGAFTPSAGIVGNTTGSAPAAGYVGQTISNTVTTSLSAATVTNVVSITVTPGIYLCGGSTTYTTFSAPTNLIYTFLADTAGNITASQVTFQLGTGTFTNFTQIPASTVPVLITTTQTLYLNAYSGTAVTTLVGTLYCTRIS